MSKSRLRRFAGRVKTKVLYCWPYKFKERRAAKLREQLRPKVFELPPIEIVLRPEVEIHMLCGKYHFDMGVWESWSILRFLENALLYVHSDGTLVREDLEAWQRIIPGLRFVAREEADARVQTEIRRRWPLLYEWRCRYRTSAQLVDMHLLGDADRFLVMDSDVLCFREPIEVKRSLFCDKPVFRWNRDDRTCYSENIDVLNSITGLKLPEAFNAGFQLTPRFGSEEFEHLERMIRLLQADGRIDTNHLWSSQTYCAMCATRCPKAKPLPVNYAVVLGQTSEDTVLRHYCGVPAMRPRYFTEGVPKLLGDL